MSLKDLGDAELAPPVQRLTAATFRPLTMQVQKGLQWCWAATCQALARKLRGKRHSQCQLAGYFHQLAICNNGKVLCVASQDREVPVECDMPHPIVPVMQKLRILHFSRGPDRPVDVIRNLKERRYPLCVLQWAAGNAHAVVISGVGTLLGDQVYIVYDPQVRGVRFVPCEQFEHDYNCSKGTWVATHYGA